MNTKKKIEQYLHIAPKPLAPDGLLEKLEEDINATKIKTRKSAIRRWFAPTGNSISLRRVAAAAAIAIVVMLPLSYGAAKVIKYFTTFEATFEHPEDNVVYSVSSSLVAKGDTHINTVEDAKKSIEEFVKLYKEGKAKEVEPGVWVVTLSNGEEFAFAGNPEHAALPDSEKKELFRKQFDEINELRKASKYERTFIKEIEKDGVKIRLYQDRFTLSNGKVVTLTSGEGTDAEEHD